MSEAGWGTDKPTVAGWYWWREEGRQPEIVRVIPCPDIIQQTLLANFTSGRRRLVRDIAGEWLGPITPDAYAAGRVDALKGVQNKLNELSFTHGPSWRGGEIGDYCQVQLELIEAQAQGGEHGAI